MVITKTRESKQRLESNSYTEFIFRHLQTIEKNREVNFIYFLKTFQNLNSEVDQTIF